MTRLIRPSLLVLVVALAACGVAAAAADTSSPAPPPGPTPTLAYTAKILLPTDVYTRPGGGRVVEHVATIAAWAQGPQVFLVLASKRLANGVNWLRVQLPTRPNGASAWIREDFVRLSTTLWRISINRATHTIRVTRNGQLQRSFLAVVGKASTPTPRGLYAVYEKVHQQDESGFIGPWALHLTAHSDVFENFGGGPGRVAIHGRGPSSLGDPLGSSRSHGCVRIDNVNIIWMARVVPLGTPVEIV